MEDSVLLRVDNLKVHFPLRQSLPDIIARKKPQYVRAVDGVSFLIQKGKTLAVVGESGCGKTTLGRSIVRLINPVNGRIYFRGQDISQAAAWKDGTLRKEIQYIFQNPYASLNPKATALEIVRRPMDIFGLHDKSQRDRRALQLLGMTGIATSQSMRYPHEFSGGQRQRISIARALAVEPSLIIADEPTSALDVSIQCQILDLLAELQRQLDLSMLFISHDLGVVEFISDDVMVMYLGHVVETGNTRKIFRAPAHPYSRALVDALPRRGSSRHEARVKLKGYIPSPINPPQGCLLHPRCQFAQDICRRERPVVQPAGDGHLAACHFAGQLELGLLAPA
ncbi:MAG: ATP-binding cassette domain-containing protein [Rhodobacteraceae bacterium]|nr:ATP-binding cassette domain-containing protein [Paracoccaceae bacterium]